MSIRALSLSPEHSFTKQSTTSLTLLPDLGVKGDCHCSETVQHRSRLHIRPPPKDLRQVHLMDLEILEQLDVKPGDLGENITMRGMGLLGLGTGTRLHFLPSISTTAATTNGVQAVDTANSEGQTANEAGNQSSVDPTPQKALDTPDHPILVVTGLRNPCPQISHFRSGLQERFVDRDEQRKIIARRAGVMSTVEVGGVVAIGMRIVVEEPPVWKALECV